MAEHPVALIPVGAEAAALSETTALLMDVAVPYRVLAPDTAALERLDVDPAMVIVQSARLTVDVLDLVRRLAQQHQSVLALVGDLNEEGESIVLDAGALDVMGLPTSRRRLRTRIVTMHRYLVDQRAEDREGERYRVVDVVIDPARREVHVHGTPVPLTKTEFNLLLLMARHPRQVLTREELTSDAGDGRPLGPHALESHLSRLRSKIEAVGGPRLVESVRGVGYRLRG
ncbi:winged helix-turn-helix transcriptional regulator [Ornithinicoccus halotolerans]|uniref:winged helix-turn-helix transcriptional regulator n=1 Tax=Ornithinicoccus halotolerans TaxID=1748220 RepID=UPI00129820EF|nr:response regulator transcription factor [Ornithinicoccus halotolerans]